MMLTEITGINDIIVLLAVTTTQMRSYIHFVHFIVCKLEIRMKNVQIFVYKQTILPVLEKLHHAHIQLHQNSSRKTQIHIFRDKSSGRTCLKWLLLSTISLIYYFILFKCR